MVTSSAMVARSLDSDTLSSDSDTLSSCPAADVSIGGPDDDVVYVDASSSVGSASGIAVAGIPELFTSGTTPSQGTNPSRHSVVSGRYGVQIKLERSMHSPPVEPTQRLQVSLRS